MPGALAYDFGEGLRTGITTAKEDEQDVSKIHADINMPTYSAPSIQMTLSRC